MTRTSLNIRIANAMQGAALHVWNLMQVNTERVLTAQDIARHYAAMGRKNPTQSKYYISELTRVQWPYERTAGEGEGWTYNDEGCINITVDNFACRLWDTGIFAILARFEVIAGIKPANRVRFTRIEAEELPAVEVVEVETVAEVAPVAEVEDIEPEPEQHHTSAALFINGYIAAMVAVMAAFIVFVVKPQSPTAAAMVAPAQVATVAAAPVAEPEPEAEPEVMEISATLENVEIMPDYEARAAEIERVKAYLIAHYVHPQPIDLTAEEIEEPEVMPIDCTPIYSNSEELEEIADTLTEEESDTADTITEDQSDTETESEGEIISYSCSGYTVLMMVTATPDGQPAINTYIEPIE